MAALRGCVDELKVASAPAAVVPGQIVQDADGVSYVVGGAQSRGVGEDYTAYADRYVDLDAESALTLAEGELVGYDTSELKAVAADDGDSDFTIGTARVEKTNGQLTVRVNLNRNLLGANPVGGESAGEQIRCGESMLDGANPTPIAHGLGTCVSFVPVLKGSAAPGVGTTTLTVVISGANANVYGWKPTSNADPTLIASTGTESFYWIAMGTD